MMPSRTLLLPFAVVLGCSSPQSPRNTTPAATGDRAPSAAGPKASGPKPTWVGRAAFAARGSDDGLKIYGGGEVQLEEKDLATCWDPRLMITAAENRGRAAIAQIIGGDGDLAAVELNRSDAVLGWYDGDRTLHILVGAPLAENKGAKINTAPDVSPPTEGVTPEALIEHLRSANRARLEVDGLCSDPYKRGELGCCGPINTFCRDQKRFDARGPNDTCSCGDGPPCLYDFQCTKKGENMRCTCQGSKCPCEGLACDAGEICGDGRCY